MKRDICVSLDMIMTGVRIKRAIAKSGLTISEIQKRLELSCPQPVYRWMSGQAMPSLDNLFTLSGILGVHMEDLLLPRHSQMWILHFGINGDRGVRMKFCSKVAKANIK